LCRSNEASFLSVRVRVHNLKHGLNAGRYTFWSPRVLDRSTEAIYPFLSYS